MLNCVFFVEKNENLYENHLFFVRKLYQPIIGTVATSLYSYLFDLFSNKSIIEKTSFRQQEVCSLLNIDNDLFIKARRILEAVGLLKTFINSDSSKTYLVVLKPLDIEKFDANKFLKNELVKNIGQIGYENIYYSLRVKNSPKDDFIEVGLKFSDLFDINLEPKKNIESTDEIYFNENINIDEAIRTLPSVLFIKYLNKKNASFSEKNLINHILQFGFQDNSINFILNYSFEKNGKIVPNFVKKIIDDLYRRDIMKFSDILEDFENIKKPKAKINYWEDSSFNNDKEFKKMEKLNSNSSTKEIDFEKLVEEISGIS